MFSVLFYFTDEWGEKTVSVLLDGEETIMDIIEIQTEQVCTKIKIQEKSDIEKKNKT